MELKIKIINTKKINNLNVYKNDKNKSPSDNSQNNVDSNENKNKYEDINFLNVMYTNTDSLSNKINEVEEYAKLYKADLILITEHLSKNSSSNFSNIYNINGFNCLENNEGRGVCIFYNNKLDITKHDMISEMFSPSLFINIKTRSKPVNVGLIYRSPNSCEK